MLYAPLAIGTATCSSIGAALIVFKFCRDWQICVSSVRWLFTVFFSCLLVNTTMRVAYYSWLAAILSSSDPSTLLRPGADPFTPSELDRLGIHALMHLRAASNGLLVAIVTIGDTALFGASFWVFALTYELSKILSVAMDRGAASERAKIRMYAWIGHVLIVMFAAAELAIAIAFNGYSRYMHTLLLFVYTMQIASLAYMVTILVVLKLKGRNVESIHGRFVSSPIYRRLKCIMIVYASFALEFQVSSLILYVSPDHSSVVLEYLGVSIVLFMATVLALAVVTGCSLPCFLRACPCAFPVEMREHMELLTDDATFAAGAAPTASTIERLGPWSNPVFVFTDIESSSALWAIGDGRIMQRAVQIHDDILRAALTKYRGYEITTAGDAFQLAFHTIREAATYCLDVQMRLLTANWPKELHGLVAATTKERQAHRYIFRGLRVRMGIHDAAECEGRLVVDVHVVTGKTTYTGTSEVIASTVGDLGAGGQIVVTRRVAEWLEQNRDLLSERFEVEWLSDLVVPQVNVHVELFEVLPAQLRGRRLFFNKKLHGEVSMSEHRQCSPAMPGWSTSNETMSSNTPFPMLVSTPEGTGSVTWTARHGSVDHVV